MSKTQGGQIFIFGLFLLSLFILSRNLFITLFFGEKKRDSLTHTPTTHPFNKNFATHIEILPFINNDLLLT